MAKKKTNKAKIKRAPKAAVASKPKLIMNTDEVTNWLDKFIAQCKVWFANFVKWLKTLNTPSGQ